MGYKKIGMSSKLDNQALLNAKYCPRVAAVSHTKTHRKTPKYP